MRRLAQATAYTVMLKLFLSSDHVSPATGKTVAIKISKAGGAFADPNAGTTNATEVSNGWYKVALDTTDTGTLGDLVVRGTAASCDDSEQVMQVVKATNGGLTGIPDAVAGANGGLPLSVDTSGRVDVLKINGTSQTARDVGASVLLSAGTGTGQLDFASGVVKANLAQILGTALTETAGQIAAGFKKFFNVASPAMDVTSVNQTGDSYARIGAAGAGLTSLGDARIANLDAAVSTRSTYAGGDTSGTTTLLSRLTSTRAGLLDHLDADISSRLASGSYTAPDNADIAAIKAKTDNLPSDPASASTVAAEITAVQNHGDTYWLTANGFSTTADITTAVSTIEGYGDTHWSTATGFATPGDVPAAADNAAAVLAATYEGSETVQAHLRLTRAALVGKANGLAGSTVHYRDAADSKDRISAIVDSDGNRASVTTDAT